MRAMPSLHPPLFKRLRRHRGLWLLVVAVLLIKLVGGSVCVADGGARDGFSARMGIAATMTAQATQAAQGDGDCLLGEGSACHCNCAHATGLPSSVVQVGTVPQAPTLVPIVDAGRMPAMTATLLRPPIA